MVDGFFIGIFVTELYGLRVKAGLEYSSQLHKMQNKANLADTLHFAR